MGRIMYPIGYILDVESHDEVIQICKPQFCKLKLQRKTGSIGVVHSPALAPHRKALQVNATAEHVEIKSLHLA